MPIVERIVHAVAAIRKPVGCPAAQDSSANCQGIIRRRRGPHPLHTGRTRIIPQAKRLRRIEVGEEHCPRQPGKLSHRQCREPVQLSIRRVSISRTDNDSDIGPDHYPDLLRHRPRHLRQRCHNPAP